MTETTTRNWLSENWVWILLLLIAGFLIYVLFHKAKVYEFTARKTIDSLYDAVTKKNIADSVVVAKLTDSTKYLDSENKTNRQHLAETTLQNQIQAGQISLLTYKLKHTPAGVLIDSAGCIELSDKVDSLTAHEAIKDMETATVINGLGRRIELCDSINILQAMHITRTDSAYAYTKNQADTCAIDNRKMVNQVKKQGIVTKIVAGFAIVFLAITVSDHIK